MKRTLAVVLSAALLLAAMPAAAGGYGGHYGYGYRHHGHSSVHISGGEALAFVAIGALVGALVARSYQPRPAYHRPAYYSRPVHTRTYAANCQPTTGEGTYRGRPAVFGGTFCRDAYGQGYIIPGSEHFLGYR